MEQKKKVEGKGVVWEGVLEGVLVMVSRHRHAPQAVKVPRLKVQSPSQEKLWAQAEGEKTITLRLPQ